MVEDPWRSLRQTQNRPPSGAKSPPQKGDESGKRADNPAATLQEAKETDGAEVCSLLHAILHFAHIGMFLSLLKGLQRVQAVSSCRPVTLQLSKSTICIL